MELHQRLNLDHLIGTASTPEGSENASGTDSTENTLAALIALINTKFDTEPSPDTALAQVDITSLDRIELAIRIEETFGVRVNEAVYEANDTVADLANYVDQHSAKAKTKDE